MNRFLLLFLAVCTHHVAEAQYDGTFPGNKYVFGHRHFTDTFSVPDPATGQSKIVVINTRDYPVTVNGDSVLHTPAPMIPDIIIEDRMLRNLDATIPVSTIPDCALEVQCHGVIVGGSGKVVFTDLSGVWAVFSNGARMPLQCDKNKLFANMPALPLADVRGKKVPYFQQLYFSRFKISVFDHHVQYMFLN